VLICWVFSRTCELLIAADSHVDSHVKRTWWMWSVVMDPMVDPHRASHSARHHGLIENGPRSIIRGVDDSKMAHRRDFANAAAGVVEAAVAWAAVDYGDAAQLHADALLADAVRDYVRAQATVPRRSLGTTSGRPDGVDV
jgi:hypothetical protein